MFNIVNYIEERLEGFIIVGAITIIVMGFTYFIIQETQDISRYKEKCDKLNGMVIEKSYCVKVDWILLPPRGQE